MAFNGAHCTRLDVARDTSGIWTPGRLWSFIKSRRRVADWRDFKAECDDDGQVLVVRCGSRSSDAFLRVYDKRREMEARGVPCPFRQLTRWKFEIKGDLAPRALEQVAAVRPTRDDATGEERWTLERLHAAWLRLPRLDLMTEPVDREGKHQDRATSHPDWLAFLAPSNGAVLVPGADERTPGQIAEDFGEWVISLCASLAAVEGIAGPNEIAYLIGKGLVRLSAKHRMLIERLAETRAAIRAVLGLSRNPRGGESGSPP